MGGGGGYYDRDVSDGYARTQQGYSITAAEKMGRTSADPGLLPKDRKLVSSAKAPVVFAFDVTGSMGTLPRIIYDKMPLIAGQIVECGYLNGPEMSLAAIGDIVCDRGPIQICEFSQIRKLDDWLERIWLEGGGGGQAKESYEYTAYFYARMCEMPEAETPFLIFTGDEGHRETLYGSDLARVFGGNPKNVEASEIFEELKKKFKGNVVLIRRKYSGSEDQAIQEQWEKTLGVDYVVPLGSDQAIADVTLGVFALMTRTRTLEDYLADLKTKRAVPQTDERVAEVRASLVRLWEMVERSGPAKAPARRDEDAGAGADPDTDAGPDKKKKPGRIF